MWPFTNKKDDRIAELEAEVQLLKEQLAEKAKNNTMVMTLAHNRDQWAEWALELWNQFGVGIPRKIPRKTAWEK